jgi:hypothetical protein
MKILETTLLVHNGGRVKWLRMYRPTEDQRVLDFMQTVKQLVVSSLQTLFSGDMPSTDISEKLNYLSTSPLTFSDLSFELSNFPFYLLTLDTYHLTLTNTPIPSPSTAFLRHSLLLTTSCSPSTLLPILHDRHYISLLLSSHLQDARVLLANLRLEQLYQTTNWLDLEEEEGWKYGKEERKVGGRVREAMQGLYRLSNCVVMGKEVSWVDKGRLKETLMHVVELLENRSDHKTEEAIEETSRGMEEEDNAESEGERKEIDQEDIIEQKTVIIEGEGSKQMEVYKEVVKDIHGRDTQMVMFRLRRELERKLRETREQIDKEDVIKKVQ